MVLLATPDPVHGWLYVGRVGSGFSDALMREVTRQLEGGGRKPTAHIPTEDTDLRGATWFAPRFVVEVFYRGIGGQQLLRQASFKALRPDKRIADLADSDAGNGPAASSSAKRSAKTRAAKNALTQAPKRAATRATAPARKSAVATPSSTALPTLSSPTKLIYPDIRATKGDVWDYYGR